MDDNGDGLGTPADWFRGTRATKKTRDGLFLDGRRAQQFHLVRNPAEQALPAAGRKRLNELNLAIAHLRETKAGLPEDLYYHQLECFLLESGRLYEPKPANHSSVPSP